jgi:hypothetical protein
MGRDHPIEQAVASPSVLNEELPVDRDTVTAAVGEADRSKRYLWLKG